MTLREIPEQVLVNAVTGQDNPAILLPLLAQLMMPQVREPRKYEDNSHYDKDGPAQPLGRRPLVGQGPTREGNETNINLVYVGKVIYLDYEHGAFQEGNTFVPFLHKRLSFAHEHELRAVIQPITAGPLTESAPFADGLLVAVDLQRLIECVYVAPTSEEWFVTLVENVARKYGIEVPIRHSDLTRDPLY